jgi:drug/metabolite transporter (DMT)-like permease
MSDPRYPDRPPEPGPRRADGAWVGAIVLIAIGAVFLARNLGVEMPDHWWALFILIPAVASFASATRSWQAAGRLTGPAIASIVVGIGLLALTAILLFGYNINWNYVWPVVLIGVGVSLLIRHNISRRD